MVMKQRGESQFPEAGVKKEWPTYAVYSGTQQRPIVTGLWRRSTAEVIHQHAQTPEGTARRHQLRAEHEEIQKRK